MRLPHTVESEQHMPQFAWIHSLEFGIKSVIGVTILLIFVFNAGVLPASVLPYANLAYAILLLALILLLLAVRKYPGYRPWKRFISLGIFTACFLTGAVIGYLDPNPMHRNAVMVFTVVLEVADEPQKIASELFNISSLEQSESPLSQPSGKQTRFDSEMAKKYPLRILLTEDNLTNQKVTVKLLQRFGYQVDVAASGIAAVDAVKQQHYNLVLMDVQMPELDGLDATRLIRQQITAAQQPQIVALTASARPEDEAMALSAGMDGFLSKPLRPEELEKCLRECGAKLNTSGNCSA